MLYILSLPALSSFHHHHHLSYPINLYHYHSIFMAFAINLLGHVHRERALPHNLLVHTGVWALVTKTYFFKKQKTNTK